MSAVTVAYGRMIDRAGRDPAYCGFWMLRAMDASREVHELAARLLALDWWTFCALWLSATPHDSMELLAQADLVRLAGKDVQTLLGWPAPVRLYDNVVVEVEKARRH